MPWDRARIAALALFVAAAILGAIGTETRQRAFTAGASVCFVLGAAAYLRWRRAYRARVLDSQDKTLNGGSS